MPVKYFLEQRISPCVAIIEQLGTDLCGAGKKKAISVQWLQALPEETVQENPWLLFF